MPRPRLPRPKLKRPALLKLPEDAWFRFATRVRAVGYWIREKAQVAGGRLARALAAPWTGRSPETRRRVGAVAAVVLLYAIVKFVPVPGVPCQLSAAKECAPEDAAIAQVPADALLYGHLTLDRDSRQYELASELAAELPDLQLLAGQLTATVPTPSGAPVDLGRDVLPWADGDLAVALLPGPRLITQPLLIAGIADRAGAEEFLTLIAGAAEPVPSEQGGSSLGVYPGGFAAAYAGDQLVFGAEGAVRRSLDAGAGRIDALEGDAGPRGELPEVRFADLYLSRAGVRQLLAGGGTGASQLDTFVDYGATRGMAASATAHDDGVELNLVSDLDPELLERSPTVFAQLPAIEPGLADEAGSRALGYIAVGELGPTLAGLLERAGSGGIAGSARDLADSLRQEAGVDPLRDLLPALGGQAALIAEPTDAVPFASLIVEGVDESRARQALAQIEGPLLRSLRTPGSGQVPRFEERELEDVSVRSVRISSTVELSYSVFDQTLVVSTDPAGVAQVRAGGAGLAGTEAYERATEDLPDEVSALVFLNLDEFLGLAEQAGLAEDPLYATLSDDLSRFQSLGLAVTGDEEKLYTELFLATD